jgi:hypothetical protein
LIASVLVSLPETEPSPIINIFARTSPWALGEEGLAESKKNSRRRSKLSAKKFFAVSKKKLSAKNFLARVNGLSLGEEFLQREFFSCSRRRNLKKITFSPSIFFLSSTCTCTKVEVVIKS